MSQYVCEHCLHRNDCDDKKLGNIEDCGDYEKIIMLDSIELKKEIEEMKTKVVHDSMDRMYNCGIEAALRVVNILEAAEKLKDKG